MKTTRWLLLAIMICFAASVKAQFPSSDRVYTYQYDYTDDDGIKYKKAEDKGANRHYQWVCFQKDMMGRAEALRISYVRDNLRKNPNYYQDEARNDLASSYSRYKSGPGATGNWANSTVGMYKYYSEYSTGSKTTYRYAYAQSNYNNPPHWGALTWSTTCYTFSNDKSELIIWETRNPETRHYYKRIEESDLCPKANMDFLY